MKLSFIIPCYGSEHTLANVIAELDSVMAQRPEYDYEIILTDDCSPDKVWSVGADTPNKPHPPSEYRSASEPSLRSSLQLLLQRLSRCVPSPHVLG